MNTLARQALQAEWRSMSGNIIDGRFEMSDEHVV